MVNLYTHPQFAELSDAWQNYHDFFEGNKKVLTQRKYLVPHQIEDFGTEGTTLRQIREARTEYTNNIEPVVSSYLSLFFKEKPKLDDKILSLFGDEINDIDGTGKSLHSFLRDDLTTNYLVYGKPLVYVDAPAVQAKTVQEAKALGLRPYIQIINPLNAPDWQIGKNGYSKFRFEYIAEEPRETLEQELKQVRYSKAFYLKGGKVYAQIYKSKASKETATATWEKDGAEIELVGLTELPIITTFNGFSWIKDILPLARLAYNTESAIDNINLNQGFQRLFIATDASADEFIKIGETAIGRLPANSTLLTVEPVDTIAQERRLAQIAMAIYKLAFNIPRVLPSDSGVAQGSETLKEQKQSLVDLIVSQIEEVETIANRVVNLYAKFKGVEDFQGKIEFSKDVTDDDLDQVKATFLTHQSYLNKYPTLVRNYIKKMAQSMNLEEEDEILKEIDNTEVANPIEEAKKERLQGQGGQPNSLREKLNNTAVNG